MLNLSPNLTLMSIPDWLDEDFLSKALVTHEKDESVVLKTFNIKAVANPGEQCTISTYRVQVVYEGENGRIAKHLFLKTTACGSDEGGVLRDAFSREIDMYSRVIPEIERLFRSTFEEIKRFSPRLEGHLFAYCNIQQYLIMHFRLIYHELCSASPVLIFEDIGQYGYKMQVKQLDMKKTKSFLSRLAQFHAGSIGLEEENPGTLSSTFQMGSLQLRPDMKIHIKECFGMFFEAVRGWNVSDGLALRVELLDTFDVEFERLFNVDKNHINVLNHGTLHNRNVMYNKDKGDDFVILDYQMCIFGSPALDLIFTLYLIGEPGLDQKVLVDYYFEQFLNATVNLGLQKHVDRQDLYEDMESHKLLGNLMIYCSTTNNV